MPNQEYTIRQMCDRFEVTPRTLRFYESKELISPERVGQQRVYRKREAARIQLILLGKKFGFSLEELRQLLGLYDLDDAQVTQLSAVFEVGKTRLSEMKKQRDELDITIKDLEQRVDWAADLIASKKLDKLAEQGLKPEK